MMDSYETTTDGTGEQSFIPKFLEILFPGVSYLSHLAFLLVGVKFLTEYWGGDILSLFVSTVQIRVHDETYNYVMDWVAKHHLSRGNHRLFVSTTISNEQFGWDDGSGTKNDDDDQSDTEDAETSKEMSSSEIEMGKTRTLRWTPAIGTHFFRYNGRIVAFTRAFEDRDTIPYSRRAETLSISCLGRDATILKHIVKDARARYSEKEKGRTVIFRATKSRGEDEMKWTRCMSRPSRPMSTVVLDPHLKQSFLDDIQRYLLPQTKRWYATRGIPYRRGYLFYGPSGTGKTSLVFAAAGLLGLKIYIISLNSPRLTEDDLATAFLNLPRRCMVLLEDVDAAGMTASRNLETGAAGIKSKARPGRRGRISLSALLNVIDGVAAHEGRVLVMTSNHREQIDLALLRPGRVDFSIRFKLAGFTEASDLFIRMYTSYGDVRDSEPAKPRHGSSGDDPLDSRGETSSSAELGKDIATLSRLAESFARKLPDQTFAPAEIQGLLLKYPNDPSGAVAATDEWVKMALADKGNLGQLRVESPEWAEDPSDVEEMDEKEYVGELPHAEDNV
ncbi:hypothetical protein NUW58_g5229 [Xylaria curta]|uniref:Uncharacterized protein n=1 Tax=Xylaria curta TaxID=42375 RepID=A0ACC1P5B3_9PEZI|nr:hypothetical protein NUW58_g5229 [Xylaria curta]